MAYSFPLTIAQFMAILPIREIGFYISEAKEVAETGGGEILTAGLGARLWEGEVILDDMSRNEAAEVMAMLDVLGGTGASFMVYDVTRPGPRADITGAVLGASVPKLHTVAASTREIRVTGLPATYQLQRSDYLAFSYGSDPVRYALHRVTAPATAVAGLTPLFEVTPNIRAGYALNATVTLIRAACKAVLVPGSVQLGRHKATMTTGVSFRFKQTLR